MKISSASGADLDSATTHKIASLLKAALVAKSDELSLEVLDVEVRGIYPVEFGLRDKIRAMDPAVPDDDAAGHNLSADYWADVLTPPFFEKNRYGSNKEIRTPATVSLEWCIPSPPDYHHFNMVCLLLHLLPSFLV